MTKYGVFDHFWYLAFFTFPAEIVLFRPHNTQITGGTGREKSRGHFTNCEACSHFAFFYPHKGANFDVAGTPALPSSYNTPKKLYFFAHMNT